MKEIKYVHHQRKQHGIWTSKRRNRIHRENKGFFIKPRLNFIRFENHIETITCTSSKTKISQSFCVNIWTLRIENKNININYVFKKIKLDRILPRKISRYSLSKDITDCGILFNILENKKTLFDKDIPLFWKRYSLLSSNQMDLTEKTESRNEFLKVLPYHTLRNLFQIEKIDFPRNVENEILLFITFQDLDSFYIISMMDMEEFNYEIASVMALPFNRSYVFSIRIISEKKDIENKKFRLEVKSWDNMIFEEI